MPWKFYFSIYFCNTKEVCNTMLQCVQQGQIGKQEGSRMSTKCLQCDTRAPYQIMHFCVHYLPLPRARLQPLESKRMRRDDWKVLRPKQVLPIRTTAELHWHLPAPEHTQDPTRTAHKFNLSQVSVCFTRSCLSHPDQIRHRSFCNSVHNADKNVFSL